MAERSLGVLSARADPNEELARVVSRTYGKVVK